MAAVLVSPYRSCTVVELLKALRLDDERVNYPEQVVRDAATDLRRALRAAREVAGLPAGNPLPSTGRGKDLSYHLEMP
jgi:hypothetical protein